LEKPSLARNLANFIKDRHIFYDGIIYMSLRSCESSHMFLTRLTLAIQTNKRQTIPILEELNQIVRHQDSNPNEILMNEEDKEKCKLIILKSFRDKEILLIMDN
jgi:hypothetical protein